MRLLVFKGTPNSLPVLSHFLLLLLSLQDNLRTDRKGGGQLREARVYPISFQDRANNHDLTYANTHAECRLRRTKSVSVRSHGDLKYILRCLRGERVLFLPPASICLIKDVSKAKDFSYRFDLFKSPR